MLWYRLKISREEAPSLNQPGGRRALFWNFKLREA
jgi:hypothetical protein